MKRNKIIIIIELLIIFILGGYIIYDKTIVDKKITPAKNTNKKIIEKTVSDELTIEDGKIKLDVKEVGNKGYKLNDNFTIKFVEKNSSSDPEGSYSFDVVVNDKVIISDWTFTGYKGWYDFYIGVLDNYIVFNNIGTTDIRSKTVYVISKTGDIVNSYYELEEIEGMVVSKFSIENNKLIITASRVTHGPSIVYNGMNESCDKIKSLDPNLSVEGTYTYIEKDGKFQLENNTSTLSVSQFIETNKPECK